MSQVRSLGLTLLALCCVLAVFTPNAFAQSDTASISGFVKDATGAVVPNVNISIKNEATGVERRATSNQSGYYIVSSLPPGFYAVSAEATGFKRFEQTQTKLDPNISTTVDVSLQVGATSETIEVVASAAQVQSETATVGRLVEQNTIQNMPLNGRNPLYLAQLKPGVRRGSSMAGFGYGLDSGGFSINGSRSQDNLITFDGAVAVRTRSNGTSIGVADVDSVQEIQILTANYNAEYGRSSGGQIRIITKSGQRDFHGDAYEFFRNSAMNANSWARNRSGVFDQYRRPAPFRYNQFGYAVSGPIFIPGKVNSDRNKLFFLWGQEWVRFREEQTVQRSVPTERMRNGDFGELLTTNQFFSGARVINDPTTGAPFPNNMIPAGRTSRNGLALLRAYPLPTPGFVQGTNNYTAAGSSPRNQRKDTVSIDFNPAQSHAFRWRLQNYNFFELSPFDGNFDRVPRTFERPNQTTSLNYIWTINPTTVNEFLATASVDRVRIDVDTSSGRFDRTKYGIDYPYIFPEGKLIGNRIPTITLGGFTELSGGPYPASSAGPIYQIANNTTKILGNHTVKFGVSFERSGQNDFDQINVSGVPGGTNNQNGRFVFSDGRAGATGLSVGNAALGLYDTYAEIGIRSYTPYRGHMFEWFAQDSWKVNSKLRLELGLRHSIIQPYYSLWGNMAVFDPKLYDPAKAPAVTPQGLVIGGDRYNGMLIPGDGFPDSAKGRVPIADTGEFNRLFRGTKKYYSDIQKNAFQPRIGIAYALNEKTVLRTGVGRFFTRLGVSDSIFLGGNPPLQPIVSLSNGQIEDALRPGNTGVAFPLNVTTQDPIFKNPEAYTWNATFEREVGFASTVEVGYVGRRGLHGQRERNLNQLAPGTIQANRGVNPDSLRPYQGYGPIRITNNEAESTYHGLQLGLNRRFSKGLSFGVAYTLSKSEDNGSAQRDILPNAFDDTNLWGPSEFDTRHIAVVNWIYQLPFFRDKARLSGKLLGGWQVAGVSQFQTGRPFTVGVDNVDFAGVGPGSGVRQLYNQNGSPTYDQKFSFAPSDQNYWFQPNGSDGKALFTEPAQGTFTASRSRNSVYAPGFQNWNLALSKEFGITENHRFRFRAEGFNWINHPNLGGANGEGLEINPRSANFGKVTAKGGERQLQLSLRYSF